jgi:fatty-acyl-CoA synthase
VARPDERWGEVPVAFVALRPGTTATADELVGHCRARSACDTVPKAVTFVDALPRDPSRKVLERELWSRG